MVIKARLILALVFLVLSVLVDFHQHNPVGFIRRGVGSSSCNIGMADIKNSF